jgi:hypothetical protein
VAYALLTEGRSRMLVRSDARNVRVRIERGLTVSEADRGAFPACSIFLDGVYRGPPFLDNHRRHYALDHHAGVIRPFTLSTCEQAAVIVALGLPLEEGEWNLYVNEPDLDALLAVWVLLHHDHLAAHHRAALARAMPMLRVEGNIDTHGLALATLSGITPARYGRELRRLERLRRGEAALRRSGRWQSVDPLRYAKRMLGAIDRELWGALPQRPSAPRRRAASTRPKVAILVRSRRGIFEIERWLRARFGQTLARVVLDRGDGAFTLLQADPFLEHGLTDVYPRLDAAEPDGPYVDGDGWGGADDIGGSPRRRASRLSGEEVLTLLSVRDGLEPVVVDAKARRRGGRSSSDARVRLPGP